MLDKQGFDDWAKQYDSTVDLSREEGTYPFCGYDRVHDRVAQLASGAKSVLDLGVGTARLTERLYNAGAKITGVDFSENMLEVARQKMPDATLICADFSGGLPKELDGQKFDVVMSLYAIHHLTDEQKADVINSAAKLLNKGGMFIIGDVAFATEGDLESARELSLDKWDDAEHYTVCEKLFPLIDGDCFFERVSFCAGIVAIYF